MRSPFILTAVSALLAAVSGMCPEPELKSQSPIDIPQLSGVPNNKNVDVAFPQTSNGVLRNEGETLKLFWDGGKGSHLNLKDKTFSALQFHFHAPSEHRVRGYQYPFEMHIVHQATDKSLAVLGVLFEVDPNDNDFLNQVWPSISQLGDKGTNVSVSNIAGSTLNIGDNTGFFRYQGSLTTPPYAEGVEWTVVREVQKISQAQLDAYTAKIAEKNAREVQPLYGRKVILYEGFGN
ncbi:hypothetical protein THRCLA_01708 [Thraustotheca clavata]|uniref:Carbonic anhydrase n=1 Tax=Thraustotheca clavata TaxID=74557 RepID=A0A0A7CLW8_9STRA|nr:secreted protein [Thraustotheca clavata]OQS06250.1 hypothetical protein THRCLA_01708 [Thraustotheca clavata]